MSLNELVDMYNQKLSAGGSRSTLATDPSHHTPQSTFTMNTGFDSLADSTSTMSNFNSNLGLNYGGSSSLLYDLDSSRFHLNDRVLAGEIVRPPPHNQPRIEKIKLPDRIQFSSEGTETEDYESNPDYTSKYPDVKHQLNIINAQQAKLPPVNMNINPGEQIQQLIQQGKLKDFHGYVNYPYNYVEPPWYFDQADEQQGSVNLNPPRSYLTGQDLESNSYADEHDLQLPYGVPQDVIARDRYELIPLPKLVYENYVPLVATRRIVYRRPNIDRVQGEPSFAMASKLPEVAEMTFKI